MILTTLLALALQGPALTCPVMLEEVDKNAKLMDYNGVRYAMCCDHCVAKFKNDTAKVLSNKKLEGSLVGYALFDPITGVRIEEKGSKAYSDYHSVRYYFASADEKKTFDTKPEAYTAAPKKEALWCPVMGHAVEDYATAGGYVNVGDTRYYVCCGDCLKKMQEAPAALADGAKGHVQDVTVIVVKPVEK
jgi:YHS domain-containing protein